MLRTNRLTNRQTDGLEILPTPTDIVCVGNNNGKDLNIEEIVRYYIDREMFMIISVMRNRHSRSAFLHMRIDQSNHISRLPPLTYRSAQPIENPRSVTEWAKSISIGTQESRTSQPLIQATLLGVFYSCIVLVKRWAVLKHNKILTMSDINGAVKLQTSPANDEIPIAWLLHKS